MKRCYGFKHIEIVVNVFLLFLNWLHVHQQPHELLKKFSDLDFLRIANELVNMRIECAYQLHATVPIKYVRAKYYRREN